MHKKGDGLFSLESLLGLIFGIIVFLAVLNSSPVRGFFQWFVKDSDQATLKNFETLVLTLQSPVSAIEPEWKLSGHPYYLSSNFILVGFSKDESSLQDRCGSERISKPSHPACQTTACLCLYPEKEAWFSALGDDDDFTENYPRVCKSLDVDRIFTRDYTADALVPASISQNLGGGLFTPTHLSFTGTYRSFVLYGQCEDYWKDENFGIQKLLFHKVYTPETSTTELFIGMHGYDTFAQVP